MPAPKLLGPLLALALLGGVGYGIYYSAKTKQATDGDAIASNDAIQVKVLTGSEK